MPQVKQVGLLAAGCQPWNKDVCAASGDRFAYCATLAIYVYQVRVPIRDKQSIFANVVDKRVETALWLPHPCAHAEHSPA